MSRAIWSNAVLGERRSWVIGWSAVSLVLFVLAVLFFSVVAADQRRLQVIGSTVPLALLAMFYWFRYVPGAVRQNSPANARLVPGLHRAVRRTTVLTWCLTLVPLAFFAAAFEHGALMFVAICVLMTSIGMARGGSAAGSVIYILTIVAMAFVGSAPGLVAWLSSAPVMVVLFVLGAAFAWNALRAVFPFGGERHWKLLPAQEAQRAAGDLERTMLIKRGTGARTSFYGWLLRRDLRPCVPPAYLLLHALGPGNHRFDYVRYLLPVLSLAILAKLLLVALGLGAVKVPLQIIFIACTSLIPLQGPNFHRLVVSMRSTRGEQALVRLAPRAPRADRLGRVLARQMLIVCLSEWLAFGAGALAVMLLFGAGATELVVLATLQCAGLASAGWPLRDYAKPRGALPVVIGQTLLVAGLVFGLFMLREQMALWFALLALLLVCALAIVYRRWQTMVDAGPPFPAGAPA